MRSHGDKLSLQGSREEEDVADAATKPSWDSWAGGAGGGGSSSNLGSAGAEAEAEAAEPSRREAHLRIRMIRRRGGARGGSWGSGEWRWS
jgi:hypothetical protein